MFATGLTGFTVRSGSFGLELLAVGELTGAGRSNGSEAGVSAVVEVVFCVCLPVRRGRVLWPVNTGAASNKTATTPRNCRIRVDLIMMASDCIRETVRFESSDSRFSRDNPSDAEIAGRFAWCPICGCLVVTRITAEMALNQVTTS